MVLRIAHRGAPHVAPENSLAGFSAALGFEPDMVECDVRLTRDGMVVIMHDPTVERTTSGHGKVSRLSFAEIRSYRLANAEPVPTLAEFLELLKKQCGMKVDVKESGMEAAVVEELRRAGAIRQTTVIAYGRRSLAAFRAAAPGLRTEVGGVYARHRRRPAIADAKRTGATIISARHTVVTAAFAEECHAKGLAIHAWTVNDAKTAAHLDALGVEAVATDRLDLV